MKSTNVGQSAETAVASKLKQDGYIILAQNWRTKVCEIDIVAKYGNVVFFVEVKHRGGSGQGTGLEYIGPRKLNKLKFAARVWIQQNSWEGDYRIMGAEVSGQGFENIELVEID